jgi:hypothetical protein
MVLEETDLDRSRKASWAGIARQVRTVSENAVARDAIRPGQDPRQQPRCARQADARRRGPGDQRKAMRAHIDGGLLR